jgi:CRP-like cAMP-binding protein
MAAPHESNHILAALSATLRRRLLDHCEQVPLTAGQELHRRGRNITHVYFIQSGVVAKLIEMKDARAAEAGMVGREGMVPSLPFVNGSTGWLTAIVQNPGHALRIKAATLLRHLAGASADQQVFHRYTAAFLAQVSQSAACNSLHIAEKRCCRWLLMTLDRVEADTFMLTQATIARMLGVRRVRISAVAAGLQERGLIRYSRGNVRVLNRAGLERACCECYSLNRKAMQRFMGA